MTHGFVIWRTIGVPIRHKVSHIRKIGGKVYNRFINDFGEIPIVYMNTVTDKLEEVVNTRGRSYAARNRLKYRNKKNLLKDKKFNSKDV